MILSLKKPLSRLGEDPRIPKIKTMGSGGSAFDACGEEYKVTLKEWESFRTADSQFVTPFAKRLTKADAVVLQDKYDSLAERFHAMEKRMEAGKFVEGTEASTTVKENDALLPTPIDEDITTVGLAFATFVAWPEHLIDVVPFMGKVSVDDHSATSLPIIDEHASKKAKVDYVQNLPADSTFNISFPDPIYGFHTEEFITINDVKDVHGRDWISASVLSMYIRYLYDNFVPKNKKKVIFVSPQANFVSNDTWKKQQSEEVANILDKNKEIVDLFFAPLNIG
ncbi:hypothetical protein Lal_00033602 [Lupinus albus]|nr:hypothetical protein Lal_00033602 [Lupinus albus]